MTKEEAMAMAMKGSRDHESECVTACFYVQKAFGLDTEQMKDMSVSTFNVLIEEIERDIKMREREIKRRTK